jgi:hypothetical protein
VLEDRASDRGDAVGNPDLQRMRMRDGAPEPGPYPLHQDLIINRPSPELPAERRDCARRSMGHIATRRACGVTGDPGPMRHLVAQERPTTSTPFGIEKVHEPESNT